MTLTLDIPSSPEVAVPAPEPRRLRVLVSAYAVSPARGSEPGMGWNNCLRLANHHDVTVLCSPCVPPDAEDFRGEIEAYLRERGPVPGLRFEFVEPRGLAYYFQRETRLRRRTVYYTGYRAWQRQAFRRAKALHEREPFDIVHQLNITGFREPGFLWQLPDVPFVWGPVGGAANIPTPFLSLMSGRERLFYKLRNVTNAVQQHTLGRCKRAAKCASHIWVVGDANRNLVENIWGCPAEPMLEVGGEQHPLGRVRTFDGGSRPLRIVWSGQHIGRKALPLLLRGMQSLGDAKRSVELTVLGDGPETPAWKSLAAGLGLNDRVRWTGRIPRDRAIDEMAAADAFVSTSVLEETSLVVLESLSLGLPVVCHDACGMGVAVTDICGIKVPMRTPADSMEGFAAALNRLSQGGPDYAALSAGALDRARELSWDSKAVAISRVYHAVAKTPR